MAIEKRIENRRDQQQLDGDGQGDFPGQGVVQESGHGGLHMGSMMRKGRANSLLGVDALIVI
jgi:hypothetical protein